MDPSSQPQLSKIQQIVQALSGAVESGQYKNGDRLPSINQYSREHKVARDTIEKAYRQLRKRGLIASYPGRGYFVDNKPARGIRVLLIFNRLSSFKKIIYDTALEVMGKNVKVDLQIHHYDPHLLREILETSLGKYHYYVIMPHFFTGTDAEECLQLLKMVPAEKIILLEKRIPQLHAPHKAVYQDFKEDIYNALIQAATVLRKYIRIVLIFPPEIHHPSEIIEGIRKACREQQLSFTISSSVDREALRKGTVYIVTEEDDLARLIQKVRQSTLMIGQDVGVISFNETVFKELLDITVVTTDFRQMGQTLAQLILSKECVQLKNPFYMIHRKSL